MDLWPPTILGLGLTALAWVGTFIVRPNVRTVALRGLAVAVLAGLFIAFDAGVLAALLFNTPDLSRILGPIGLGLVVGFVIGGAFFWLNVVVLTIGLWFKPTRSWAIGATLATPVVLAAIGFGYAAYRSVAV